MKYLKRIGFAIFLLGVLIILAMISIPGVPCGIAQCTSLAERVELFMNLSILPLALSTFAFIFMLIFGRRRHWIGKVYLAFLAISIALEATYYISRGVWPMISI